MNYTAEVKVMLKDGIADPQGQTIERALPALGYTGVTGVRVGKQIHLSVEADSSEDAARRVSEMCEKLLANTVIESFQVEIDG
ncbi:MAG: phosphoribosylformylglycinamidine synthase subunit PurS [Actinomycetota bacterium]|jgi:phosphoribosylformylglycinamidine synthase|nr:phosphoribosylformylglycinamidine synthase subunit PurS [Actinomycetota bacterium]